MEYLKLIISGVLLSLALLHLLWATGNRFPANSERALVAMVVGFRGRTEMPGAVACAVVALALLTMVAALLLSTGTARHLILSAAALGFAMRGLAAYAPPWRRLTPQQPFTDLDRRLYGPLCLLLGAGLFVLR